jgi:hypothetical protein
MRPWLTEQQCRCVIDVIMGFGAVCFWLIREECGKEPNKGISDEVAAYGAAVQVCCSQIRSTK